MASMNETLVDTLTQHQRRDDGSCTCGWVGLVGSSHAEHVAEAYETEGALLRSVARKIQAAGSGGLEVEMTNPPSNHHLILGNRSHAVMVALTPDEAACWASVTRRRAAGVGP